jgi:hypothetical protein
LNQISGNIPESFRLDQNYPNPFNPTTKIKFDIPNLIKGNQIPVQLRVYDVLGKQVAVIVNQNLSAGSYEYEWDASELTTGVYFYTLETEGFRETRKMVLAK